MTIDGIEVPEISQKDYYDLLEDGENLLILGNKGTGKSSIAKKFAKDKGKNILIFPLATYLPEFIGGVPYAQVSSDKKTEYFTLLLDQKLQPLFENEGKDWILDFDEINQAPVEVMNCLYGPCHIDPEQREWCGHSLRHVQIVAQGNLSDGSDGTVYLNELPGPLLDRFFVYQLVSDKNDVMKFLSEKWNNIPLVKQYIKVMQENNINPRNIDKCLELLQFHKNPLLLRTKLGIALTQQILDMQKGINAADPTELFKKAKAAYDYFQENKDNPDLKITWGSDIIETEEELFKKLKELISEEELASIIKGGK